MQNNIKKVLAFTVIILFICMSITPSSAFYNVKKSSNPVFNGNILYVGGIGPGNYSSIQSAIDDASDGDTVFVFDDSSPYYENIFINQSIDLIGEDKNTTVIDGRENNQDEAVVINIKVDNVTIREFTIQNSSLSFGEKDFYCCGIEILSNYSIIKNNIIIDNYFGIRMGRKWIPSNYNIITDNIIINNKVGLLIGTYKNAPRSDSNYNIIEKNIISNNEENGIIIGFSNNNNISGNFITKNGQGILLYYYSYNNYILDNFISMNQESGIYLYLYVHTNYISSNIISTNNKGIKIADFNHNNYIINNNFLSNAQSGIDVEQSYGNKIESNQIINSSRGIFIYLSNENKVLKNNIYNNDKNIEIVFSSIYSFSEMWSNKFDKNYWGRPYLFLKIIFGYDIEFGIPLITFDWHPAKEPYDIPTGV